MADETAKPAAPAYVRQIPLTCPGHTRPVVDFEFSSVTPDGFFLVSACKDGKPMLRDGATGDWIGTFEGHKGAVFGININSDATLVASGSADFSAKLWNATTGDEMQTYKHKHIAMSVRLSKDSKKLLTGGRENIVRVYDLNQSGEDVEPVMTLEGHTAGIRHVLWHDNDNTIISAGSDNCVRLWDARTGKETRNIAVGGEVACTEFSRNKYLTVTAGKEISFLDLNSWDVVKKFTMESDVNAATLHPTENRFVAGFTTDLWVHVYDFESGAELECHKGHHGPVHCVRYSPSGDTFASGSEDGTIRIWQTYPKLNQPEPVVEAAAAPEAKDAPTEGVTEAVEALKVADATS